jgi:DNA-binding IclR family transcriptional regulator
VVHYDPATRQYGMGLRFMQYGLQQMSELKLRRITRPFLSVLSEQTRETAVLALRAGFDRIYVDQIESTQPVRHVQPLWEPMPLYQGSSGRAILAFMPEADIAAYLATGPFPRLTANTITDPALLARRLEEVRLRGYDFTVAERLSETAGLSAPILDHEGRSVGALLVCGPAYRSEFIQRSASLVRRTALQCSIQLGHAATHADFAG